MPPADPKAYKAEVAFAPVQSKQGARSQARNGDPRLADPRLATSSSQPSKALAGSSATPIVSPLSQASSYPSAGPLPQDSRLPAKAQAAAHPHDPRIPLPQDPRGEPPAATYPQQLVDQAAQQPAQQSSYPQRVLSYAATQPQSGLQNPAPSHSVSPYTLYFLPRFCTIPPALDHSDGKLTLSPLFDVCASLSLWLGENPLGTSNEPLQATLEISLTDLSHVLIPQLDTHEKQVFNVRAADDTICLGNFLLQDFLHARVCQALLLTTF